MPYEQQTFRVQHQEMGAYAFTSWFGLYVLPYHRWLVGACVFRIYNSW